MLDILISYSQIIRLHGNGSSLLDFTRFHGTHFSLGLSGCTEVANILAKYPQWDRSPRRLKVPAISRDSKELPDAADHINPASWRGNIEVKNVSLQTSWRRGRRLVESECLFTAPILQSLEKDPGVNIFSP